jgi:hypothetical protein
MRWHHENIMESQLIDLAPGIRLAPNEMLLKPRIP